MMMVKNITKLTSQDLKYLASGDFIERTNKNGFIMRVDLMLH